MPNIGFTIFHRAFSFPWVGQPKGHLYFNPLGQCFSKCWSNPDHRAGPSLGNLGYVGSRTLSLSNVP